MKWLVTLGVIALGAGAISAAEPNPLREGFTVHEWGVFRVNQDADFANAELREEWDKLPAFVYGYIKGRVVPQHWGVLEPRLRPLIFFYAETAIQAQVRVDFPGGMAGVWYPATSTPSVEGIAKQPKIGGSLEWNIGIKELPSDWRPRAAPPEIFADHWIVQARKVKCDEIFAQFGPGRLDVEREKFIYYDGLFPQGKWMKFAVDGDKVSLTSQVGHPVFDITVVDRRKDKPRIGRIDKLDARKTIDQVEFVEVDAAKFVADSCRTLNRQLVAAGLFDDEAKLLIQCWKKDMFETPGLNAFYRLPQFEYDTRLPLTVKPKPTTTIRVGLIYHGHLEPDFAERILELVKQLNSERFAERDAATKKLLQIGPAALVQIQRFRDRKDLSTEVRERIDTLIKKWNAKDAFDE